MKISFLLLPLLFLQAAGQEIPNIRDLKRGRVKDDSSHVYQLPYKKGRSYLLVQGYLSSFSHKSEYALDFKMKEGTPVCAARSGVVVDLRKDSDKGGLKPAMLAEGNYIFIAHSDGSTAQYWHFQKNGVLVDIGDTVHVNQVIGLSGNTGYSAFPHLHFEVSAPGRGQVPTRFQTRKGIYYLKPGKWHKAV